MNEKTYIRLRSSVQGTDYKRYDVSEHVFLGHPLDCEEDFLKIVAFAYSWMPTIPEWGEGFDWTFCFPRLQALKAGDLDVRLNLLEHLVPMINNSIAGVSKALYFISPHNTPMIDSNVVAAWRALFFPHGLHGQIGMAAPLPSDFGNYGKDSRKRSRHIRLYVQYWDDMIAWSASCIGLADMRGIESMLYAYGKQL